MTISAAERSEKSTKLAAKSQANNTAKAMFSVEFARTLREVPESSPLAIMFTERIDALSESFGPPEKIGRLLVWNFVSEEGRATLRTSFLRGEATVQLLATPGLAPQFWIWVSARLAEISSGERAPLFIGAGRYALLTVEL